MYHISYRASPLVISCRLILEICVFLEIWTGRVKLPPGVFYIHSQQIAKCLCCKMVAGNTCYVRLVQKRALHLVISNQHFVWRHVEFCILPPGVLASSVHYVMKRGMIARNHGSLLTSV